MEYLEIVKKVQTSHNNLGEVYKELTSIIVNLSKMNQEQNEKISQMKETLQKQNEKIKNFQFINEGHGFGIVKEMKPEAHSLLEIFDIKNVRDAKNDKELKFTNKGHKKMNEITKGKKRKYCKKNKQEKVKSEGLSEIGKKSTKKNEKPPGKGKPKKYIINLNAPILIR